MMSCIYLVLSEVLTFISSLKDSLTKETTCYKQTISTFNEEVFNLFSVYKRWKKTEIETVKESNSTYYHQIGLTNIQTQSWEVPCNSNLGSQLEKGPGHSAYSMGETATNCSFDAICGILAYNLRLQTIPSVCKQTAALVLC